MVKMENSRIRLDIKTCKQQKRLFKMDIKIKFHNEKHYS